MTTQSPPIYLDATAIGASLPPTSAVAALEAALLGGLDPEVDAPRVISPVAAGELLLMPAQTEHFAGVKIASVAPKNPSRGLPKIQGVYLLFDAESLSPLAMMDGAALTLIRTPAVTVLAIKHLLIAAPSGARRSVGRLAVIGTSLQAWEHIRTAAEVLDVGEVVVLGRREDAAAALAARAAASGIPARPGQADDLRTADVVICATSSSTAVFEGSLVKNDCVVAAIGSHGLDRREVDATLARRADVVVEGRASALREAGDLIPARSGQEWAQLPLSNLADLVRGDVVRRANAPALFTGVGMSWEDVVLAAHAFGALAS